MYFYCLFWSIKRVYFFKNANVLNFELSSLLQRLKKKWTNFIFLGNARQKTFFFSGTHPSDYKQTSSLILPSCSMSKHFNSSALQWSNQTPQDLCLVNLWLYCGQMLYSFILFSRFLDSHSKPNSRSDLEQILRRRCEQQVNPTWKLFSISSPSKETAECTWSF